MPSPLLNLASPVVRARSAGAFVERPRHHDRLRVALADDDHEARAGLGEPGRDVGHADVLLHVRPEGPRGHDADLAPFVSHGVTVPRDAAIDHLEAREAPAHALLLL